MPEQLHWETVTPLLKNSLSLFMRQELFDPFRLVGGTSLSLQLGHRESDDIDLFTDAPYQSVDFNAIDNFLRVAFEYVSTIPPGPVGMGVSYLVGPKKEETIKLDIFYTTDPFFQSALEIGHVRLATVEEIIAMKVDVVQRKGRKKDFWDLHELLPTYSPGQMIALHKKRYPYSHDEKVISENFTDFTKADMDFDPKCLRGKHWELIKYDVAQAVSSYS